MSDFVGGKAIALVQSGGVEEKPFARVFTARGSGGRLYEVTLGARPVDAVPWYSCTCPAVGRCYHGEAVMLAIARLRDEAGGRAGVMRVDGELCVRRFEPIEGEG